MSGINKPERATQDRVIRLFAETLNIASWAAGGIAQATTALKNDC